MGVLGEASTIDPEQALVCFFNLNDKSHIVRSKGCEILRLYQRDKVGGKWKDDASAQCNTHGSQLGSELDFHWSRCLWVHGRRDHVAPKYKIELSRSYMICAWLHFDSYLTGFGKHKTKWRTLASSCIDGPAKRHASYHLLLRSQNGDIQIGPYTALPDEGTKDSFKNCEGIFAPVCQPGTDTPINFYPILKDCNFFHIAVHGEAPTTGTDGTAFPGFTTIYINGKKIGECASYVGNSIETVGQCARYSTGANSYGIQIFTDFRVYHMPEEFCTDTPSPQTQAILKHAIEPIQTYPKLRHTHEWKTFPPTLTKSKSRSALSDSTNHQEASMKKSSVAKVKREPSSTNFSAHLGKKTDVRHAQRAGRQCTFAYVALQILHHHPLCE